MAKSDKLKKRIRKLQAELEKKNEILQAYADHRNWGTPSEVRERLGIPEVDKAGNPIEIHCFAGARYPWEPALKVLIGVPDEEPEE